MKRSTPANRIAIAAMSAAIGIVCLYAASVIPTVKLALLFFSSLCIWIPLNEKGGFLYALLTYIVTVIVSFLLIPDKLYPAAYLLFFGSYGMIKLGFDTIIHDRFIAAAVKVIACDALAAIALFIVTKILEIDVFTFLPEIPLWMIIAALQVVFVLYELLYSLCAKAFDVGLRDLIVTRRR